MFVLHIVAFFTRNFLMQEEIFDVLTKSAITVLIEIDSVNIGSLTGDGCFSLQITVEEDNILMSERIHQLRVLLLEALPLLMPSSEFMNGAVMPVFVEKIINPMLIRDLIILGRSRDFRLIGDFLFGFGRFRPWFRSCSSFLYLPDILTLLLYFFML